MLYRARPPLADRDHSSAPRLAMAVELGVAVSAARDMPQLIELLRGKLKWLLPMRDLALCVRDEGTGYRVVGLEAAAEPERDDDLVGWALDHGSVLDVHDLGEGGYLPPGIRVPPWCPRSGSLLVLPLRTERRAIGALIIGSPRVGAFAEIDRGLMNLVALQVTAAVRTLLLLEELDGAQAVIAGMARAVEAKDPYTHGHAERVTQYALALGASAGLSDRIQDLLSGAGPLHDVGKIGVPDTVLAKTQPLTTDDLMLIRRHAGIGDEICRPLRSLQRLRPGVRHHHERYDGRGYPDGLSGERIPLEARVLAIADAFDAMTSDRPYRLGMPAETALAIIQANEGPQWDPGLVRVFGALPLLGSVDWTG